HATVDGEVAIAHFIAVRHPLRERGFHRGLSRRFQFLYSRGGTQKILRHVPTPTERRLELFEYEKHFPVVAPGLVLGFDIYRSDLAAVLSRVEIGTRPIVRVIETETGWTRSERNPAHPRAGMNGVPSSAAPSTSVVTI